MNELLDWYWRHGKNRGNDPNDRDRELNRITIGEWLDPVARILDRINSIKRNASDRACLALWGPSQTGKSTMMSRFVDGIYDDGEDSALTWGSQKTRFSPPSGGFACLPADTLVFNPYNLKSDASGLATRYTLKSEYDSTVVADYPIEIRFATRAQIIQSLSLGYLYECKNDGEQTIFSQNEFLEELQSDESIGTPDRAAFELMTDIANVIENMRGNPRFNNLFKKGEWAAKIRSALMSCPKLLSSKAAAEDYLFKVFWDSNRRLTDFYKTAVDLLQQLNRSWEGCTVLASMEVGALLLDIDSYNNYSKPQGEREQRIRDKVERLTFEQSDQRVCIKIGSSGSTISGKNFGYFQALCAEMVVPLKEEKLAYSSDKAAFYQLAKKCDFLDLPGVSNKNKGNDFVNDAKPSVDLSSGEMDEVFTKVFKQGKTQCFVYNYVKNYGIDAFAVLARTQHYPSQSSLLSNGINEWLRSFDPEWKPGRPAEMPVFVIMTFFGSVINDVAQNGDNVKSLKKCVEPIQELSFATKETARFFATTYQQFQDGKINFASSQAATIKAIMADSYFVSATGITEENLNAVYDEHDGGLNYMFANISGAIDVNRRRGKCNDILRRDKAELLRLIKAKLPSESESATMELRAKLNDCISAIEKFLDEREEEGDSDGICSLAGELKELFSVSKSVFERIPLGLASNQSSIRSYVQTQVGRWYDDKMANLQEMEVLSREEQQAILQALRNALSRGESFNALGNFLREQFGELTSNKEADFARYPLSIALGNLIQCGTIDKHSDAVIGQNTPSKLNDFLAGLENMRCDRNQSPYYYAIIQPLMKRIEALAGNSQAEARKPQEGDAELKQIYDRVATADNF